MGKNYTKIVMDGTTLGIQKTYLPNILVKCDKGLLDGREVFFQVLLDNLKIWQQLHC